MKRKSTPLALGALPAEVRCVVPSVRHVWLIKFFKVFLSTGPAVSSCVMVVSNAFDTLDISTCLMFCISCIACSNHAFAFIKSGGVELNASKPRLQRMQHA